ncbi:isoprenylcysteine carboxyl methyltransferase family protein [Brevundimonas sp. NPDC090276]|uniref:isoprenylcysteine carboxyl methyltransferase family protein n=1 Tax=Brevundimonas sp. NPDC090276 TaxID=3363956 RepID=UPI00383B6956
MILSVVVLSLVTAQRIGELLLAGRNTRRLFARGAVEIGAGHYPFIVALHAAWLIGLWLLAWDRPLNLWLLAVFVCLQAARVWVIATLGDRWTTRIIILPGEPLIRCGPYRFLSHPNYVVVAAEILILPLAFGLAGFALAFAALNAAMMWVRVRSESQGLLGRQST